jgi:hypothetical protein
MPQAVSCRSLTSEARVRSCPSLIVLSQQRPEVREVRGNWMCHCRVGIKGQVGLWQIDGTALCSGEGCTCVIVQLFTTAWAATKSKQ